MLFLIAIVAAAVAWSLGRSRFPQSSLALKIRCADLGTVFQQPALASVRYGLVGRPNYLVRVKNGIAPVELKSGKAPRSGRPYDGHLLQLAAYCLLVEDVCQVYVPFGVLAYEDRCIPVEFTSSLRQDLLNLLGEMRTAKRLGELHINHNSPGKCRSCGFREVCGEGLL